MDCTSACLMGLVALCCRTSSCRIGSSRGHQAATPTSAGASACADTSSPCPLDRVGQHSHKSPDRLKQLQPCRCSSGNPAWSAAVPPVWQNSGARAAGQGVCSEGRSSSCSQVSLTLCSAVNWAMISQALLSVLLKLWTWRRMLSNRESARRSRRRRAGASLNP